MRYMKCPNTHGPSSIILSKYNKMGIILHCNEHANFFRKLLTMISKRQIIHYSPEHKQSHALKKKGKVKPNKRNAILERTLNTIQQKLTTIKNPANNGSPNEQ